MGTTIVFKYSKSKNSVDYAGLNVSRGAGIRQINVVIMLCILKIYTGAIAVKKVFIKFYRKICNLPLKLLRQQFMLKQSSHARHH